jgi:acyl carrier protein
VGIHDNFFALGGDSLLAGRIVARLRSRFDVEVPLPALFKYPTVSELAAEIEGKLIDEIQQLAEEDVRRPHE